MLAAQLSNGTCEVAHLAWSEVRYADALAMRQALAAKYAPASVNGHLATFRQLMKECWRLGYVDVETYQRTIDLEAVRGSRVPPGRQLDETELAKLFRVAAAMASTPAKALRDVAMLAFFASTGCRRGELVAVDLADYDVTSGRVLLIGKGNKQRVAWVATESGRAYLQDWLNRRGPAPGPLFTTVVKSGRVTLDRVDYWTIGHLLRTWSKAAEIAGVTAHDFRRTFISDRLDDGVDLETVQRMAGHQDVKMTASYSRRPERLQQEAAARVRLPRRDDGNETH